VWRDLWRPCIEDETAEGDAARAHLLAVDSVEAKKSSAVVGAELGYRYEGSPVISEEPGDAPPHVIEYYVPTTWPGARLPHMWVQPGISVLDLLGDAYTLLRLTTEPDAATALGSAFAAIGAPFAVLDVQSDTTRAV
jgi:hypothetical protein